MSSIKSLPEELLTKYKFEPSIQDIFVEGPADKNILGWYLREKGHHNVVVREIETVEIPANFVKHYLQGYPDIKNGDGGNRERVIAFSKYLKENSIPISQVKCVADKDMSTIWNYSYDCENLLFYDFSCLEMYCFNTSSLYKFLTICCNKSNVNPEDFLVVLSRILRELFLVQLANWDLGWCLQPIEWLRYCTIRGFNIDFNRELYIEKYLLHNLASLKKQVPEYINAKGNPDLLGYIQTFEKAINLYRTQLPLEPRQSINGHDFLSLLTVYTNDDAIKKSTKSGKLLLQSLEKPFLEQHAFFKSLTQGLN